MAFLDFAPRSSARCALAFAFLFAGVGEAASAPETVRRVGVVFYNVPLAETRGPMPASPFARALVEGLKERGWVEGRNLRIFWRSGEGDPGRIPKIVAELVALPVDLLVASGNDIAAETVKRAPGIPVVLGSSDYPVESGLVASLARPGGNVTGLTNWVGRALNAKRLALLKEAVPSVSRVAFFGPFSDPTEAKFSPETQAAADALGVTVFGVGARSADQLEAAFAQAVASGADAIFVLDYPFAFVSANQVRIGELAIRRRLPVIHSASTAAQAGALLTYATDIEANFQRAGYYVDRILRGAKPADLPIEQPAKLQLVVNRKAARAIGVTLPASILAQADRVID
jgi:putative ABC transport system substrate-binding protein